MRRTKPRKALRDLPAVTHQPLSEEAATSIIFGSNFQRVFAGDAYTFPYIFLFCPNGILIFLRGGRLHFFL